MKLFARLPALLRRAARWTAWLSALLIAAVIAVMVYFTWQTNRRESQTIATAAPATGRFVTAHQTKIFVQEAGPASGRPVLLIHGTGSWSEIWRETMNALAAAGFRTIALDLPPFGYSEKPNGRAEYTTQNQAKRIVGVLDALDVKDTTLVGHSVGARATLEAALQAPARITRLVLVDPALGFQADVHAPPHFEQNDAPWLVRALFASTGLRKAVLSTYGTNPLFTRKLFASFVSEKTAVTDAKVRMLQRPLTVENTTNAYGDWLAVLTVERDTSLCSDFTNFRNLRMPVSLIWGETDAVTPPWQADALKKLVPGSELRLIQHAGHIPYLENPRDFNVTLLNILSHDSAPTPTR
jgi:pimeloyl-ACP methyl ester carboxylesterase